MSTLTASREEKAIAWIQDLVPEAERRPQSVEEVRQLPTFLSKMKACEKKTGKPFDDLELVLQNALVELRLEQMINSLFLNPLWRERLLASGIRPGGAMSLDAWQQVPITEKETCAEFFMGKREGMVVPLHHGGFEIVASGGTSSKRASETVYSLRELHDTYKIAGAFMGRHQLPPFFETSLPRWVVCTLMDYQIWSSGTMVGGVLQSIPGVNYIGAGLMTEPVYQLMMGYKGDKVIMGAASVISNLVQMGATLPETARRSLKVAMYGSATLTPKNCADLKAVYPEVNILSYFAATQAETIGLQLHPENPALVAIPGLHLIEIVDENGCWVNEGEEGDLLVTRLHAMEAPVVRLRLGDRMVRKPPLERPGLKTVQFAFAGRSGDIIHLGEMHCPVAKVLESLKRSLSTDHGIDLDVAAHALQFENNRRDRIVTLRIEMDNPAAFYLDASQSHALLSKALRESLSIFNAWDWNNGIQKMHEFSFRIEPLPKGSRKMHRTQHDKVPLLRDII